MIRTNEKNSLSVVVTIQHPAHVHFFRNIIDELERAGHEVTVFARQKDITETLLRSYEIPYTVLAGHADSLLDLVKVQLQYERHLLSAVRQIQPDIMLAIGGIAASHVAKLTGSTSIVFLDDGISAANYLSCPFADLVCTPERLESVFGATHVQYPGYHELAYLHPDRFEPDASCLESFGIEPNATYSVVRFIGWNAHHDVGMSGFSRAERRQLVSRLETYGDVYITSESALPPEFEPYRLPVPSHLVHHLLSFADLYVGDSQTMATEAAILGTPSVRSNSFAGEEDMSNFVELEREYGLLHSIPDGREAITTGERLLDDSSASDRWEEKRARLFQEKIDVTKFVVDLIEESFTKKPLPREATE